MTRSVTIDLDTPDPTAAINAFLWNMNKARALGFMPKSEHMLAEHLFRDDVKLIFYSSSGGIMSLVGTDDILGDEDSFEVLKFVMEKRRDAIRRRKAVEGVAELARALCDSGRLPKGGDPSGAPCEASQSGDANAAHRPNSEGHPMSNSDNIDNQEAVKLEARRLLATAYRAELPGSEVADAIERGEHGVVATGYALAAIESVLTRTTPAKLDAPDNQEALAGEAWAVAEAAIRAHCDEHGPSGGAWNISMILERLHRALSRTPSSSQADEADVERDAETAALVALAEHGDTTDLQELLVRGSRTLPPGALTKMVRAVRSTMTTRPAGVEEVEQ